MNDQTPKSPLIRTGFKEKLAKGFCYPIGAEKISEILRDIPQFNELWIAFSKEGPLRMIFGTNENFKDFFNVVTVVYNNSSRDFHLNVTSTNMLVGPNVRWMLTNHGLPVIRKWLISERNPSWFDQFRRLCLGCNSDVTNFCAIELEKDRVIDSLNEVIRVSEE